MVNGVRFEDRLEGASNFASWKFRIMIALRDNELDEFVKKAVPEPDDKGEKPQWMKKNNKAMKMLVDAVKDHIVPIISKLEIAYDMFKSLESMYEINNTSRALALKQQLHHVKMIKGETITAYFMRITELRDQLSTIGHTIESKELTMLALNSLPSSWESFIQGISARSKLPKFDIQEESRLAIRGIGQSSINEDIHVLASNSLKMKGKKGYFKRKKDEESNATLLADVRLRQAAFGYLVF
ncbi:uncharacterized protein LOC131858597 [Cryptomeria japonica]|uniref:uncharacterized protein LOC131858597 n=1 Tax=Cryptomeria japonica TaxID=3369 RepID=UPI0027DA9D06|nr:uncharacterized protein LOC131858597 [Cryptomeria japonica]